MDPREEVASAWSEAGTETVLLPTGTEVRIMLPGPGSLARHGVTPGTLREIAARRTGKVEHAGVSDADWTAWEASIRQLLAEAVVAIRPPGREAFAEHTIHPDDRIPGADEDALVALVLHLESPAQVDLKSRAVLSGQPARAGGTAWVRTAHRTLPAWISFVESHEGLLCALTARTFGQRPSVLLGIDDPVVAYAVDEALAMRLLLPRSARKEPLPIDVYESVAAGHDDDVARQVAEAHVARLQAEGRLRPGVH